MENVAANEPGCYQASVGNKNQLNKVMDSLLNKVTARLLTCGKELKVVSSPTLQRDVTDQYEGKKRRDISDLSPVESKWINPSYRNHSSWLHPSKAKLHYTETTAAQCVSLSPRPTPQPLCLTLLCIIPDENIICLLSVCLSHTNPNPQKWQLSYTGIMLPSTASFNQERLITRDMDCYSFVATHLRDGLIRKRNSRERKCEKNRRGEITLSSPRRWQQKTEHPDIFFFQHGIRAQLFSFSTSDHTPLLFLTMQHIR